MSSDEVKILQSHLGKFRVITSRNMWGEQRIIVLQVTTWILFWLLVYILRDENLTGILGIFRGSVEIRWGRKERPSHWQQIVTRAKMSNKGMSKRAVVSDIQPSSPPPPKISYKIHITHQYLGSWKCFSESALTWVWWGCNVSNYVQLKHFILLLLGILFLQGQSVDVFSFWH